ncbi:MAG: asparaginase [candidate division Zixibacteria bacterium RBG-1]|nr:MAG: asparaginase [candidate division Zixibacteria bacterium RBG-1]OGC86688.1 MAG: hypothetical protein A2V73_04835 [candidate division Zixibacteria bacterium RBG_19FT_COMBO_42_43]
MPEILAKVYRGKTVESVHFGSVAVVDSKGRLIYSAGDPNFFTYLRSSAKPFQTIPLIESGAAEHFDFSTRELAIVSGSHNGEKIHVDTVKKILKKVGLSEKYLKCGTQPPLYYTLKGIIPGPKQKFSVLQHNCSGKHSGMLAVSKYKGFNPRDYINPKHPVQKMILKAVAGVCEYPENKIKIGIDGCSAPNFALPLSNMALGFARLVSSDSNHRESLKIVLNSMKKYPEMISGQGRLDYILDKVSGGKVISKAGAEALQCFGIKGEDLGVAVRILDGNNRAVGCVVAEVLRQLGVLSKSDLKKMEKFAYPKIKNWSGLVVGYIKADFKLKKHFNLPFVSSESIS